MELGETVRSAQSEAEVVAVGRLRHHRRLAADWDRRFTEAVTGLMATTELPVSVLALLRTITYRLWP